MHIQGGPQKMQKLNEQPTTVLLQRNYVSTELQNIRTKMSALGSCNINVGSKPTVDFLEFFSNIGKNIFSQIFQYR